MVGLTTKVREFDPRRVRPLPGQPRKQFRGINQLAKSMQTIGQTTPGIVTPVDDDPNFDAQLIDGERRLRACLVGERPFRAEVRHDVGDYEKQFLTSLASNFQRQDHNCIEIAQALKQGQDSGKTLEELGDLCGKSIGWVVQHLSLLKLHPDVQALLIPHGDEPDEEAEAVGELPEKNLAMGVYDRELRRRKSRRLTFSLALLLVPAPAEKQVDLAKKITDEAMSLTAARRFIYRSVHEGKTSIRGRRTLGDLVSSLLSLIQQSTDRFGIFIDLPGGDFNGMIDSLDREGQIDLAEVLESLSSDIAGLAEAVKERAKHPSRARAMAVR